jgi:hypothetical protein
MDQNASVYRESEQGNTRERNEAEAKSAQKVNGGTALVPQADLAASPHSARAQERHKAYQSKPEQRPRQKTMERL